MFLNLFPGFRAIGHAFQWIGLLALADSLAGRLSRLTNDDPINDPRLRVLASLTATLLIFGVLLGLWFGLRPIRLAILRLICQFMIRSGISVLLYFGLWELLTISVRAGPLAIPDYAGLAALHKTYDSVNKLQRVRILLAARQLAQSSKCNVDKEVCMFIDVVEP